MSPHPSVLGPSSHLHRRLALCLAVALVGAVALVVTRASSLSSSSSASSRRVAIRVECREQEDCALADELALDVWSEERAVGEPVDVVVAEASLDRLRAQGAAFTILDADIDATARAETERLQSASASDTANADFFAEFRDFKAIERRLDELAELAPDRVSVSGIGSSLDGRPLLALHVRGRPIPANVDVAGAPLPMLINGTQHAREWIAAMSATCIADRVVRNYDSDPAIKAFVDSTDLWIVPVVNPDGYTYSWAQDRYWRKNRRGNFGVDLNRNFSVAWGGSGSSANKRSETYRGEAAFSENESIALRTLVKDKGIKAHVDLHAYGQLVLFPWNHGAKPTDDHKRFAAIGDDIASAIYAQHQTKYRLMRGVELYPAAGTMSDWMYGEAGATSFTIELRPRGGSGFVLPPKEIKPTCDEAMAAVLALRASRNLKP